MKKNETLVLAMLLCSFASCSNDCAIEDVRQGETLKESARTLKRISKLTINLSEDDAEIVANLFRVRNKSTRSYDNQYVKEIIPIRNENGEPLIYAVNWTQLDL